MAIPSACLDLVKSFEGYGRKLPDGSCTAYQEVINGKRDVATIGYGCTVGVKIGDVWTREQAEAALAKELGKHEAIVTRLVTIELNENERGALISFSYNCGGLKGNTLAAINSGDRHKAVAAIKQWNKFGGKVCDGLVRRRAAEVALFLKPCGEVEPDYMPQAAEPEKRKMTPAEIATAAATAAGGGATVAHQTGAVPTVSSTVDTHIDKARAAVEQGKRVREVVQDARGLIPGVPKGMELPLGIGTIAVLTICLAIYLHKRV